MRELYFPTTIYYWDLPDAKALNEAILPHLYAWKAQDEAGIVRSNVPHVGAWHSHLDMHRRPEYRPLTEQVVTAARELGEDLGYDPAWELVLDNMWANIHARHGYNRRHVHPNTLWSGVYYVKSPPGAGRIVFTDPRAQAQMVAARYVPDVARKPEVWSEVYFQPIEGRLLLFPSWLPHEVEPNLAAGDDAAADRVSVSFNLYQRLIGG